MYARKQLIGCYCSILDLAVWFKFIKEDQVQPRQFIQRYVGVYIYIYIYIYESVYC